MSVPGIQQQISWVYTDNLDQTAAFYRDALGLECLLDEGKARIFQVTVQSMIGVCTAFDDRVIEPKGAMVTFVTDDVDGWYARLERHGVRLQGPPHVLEAFNIYTFFAEDPSGYVIEFQQFLSEDWAVAGRG